MLRRRGFLCSLFLTSIRSFSVSNSRVGMTTLSKVETVDMTGISFINATQAQEIDVMLMQTPGFSIDQLMELAGLSVATAVDEFASQLNIDNVLILCGPGNNGGDGLVAARHLWHFGYKPTIIYPKQNNGQLFINLMKQCRDLEIPILSSIDSCTNGDNTRTGVDVFGGYDPGIVVDSLFGFSFQGPPREPFKAIIDALATTKIPTLSVDIPSSWDVNKGDIYSTNFNPSAVISLTAPKLCMQGFTGKHYLGGRFVPPSIIKSNDLKIPSYTKTKGSNQIVEIVSGREISTAYSGENENEENESLTAIMITASEIDEAKEIAKILVQKKLVACVNIIPSVLSIYEWQGKSEVNIVISVTYISRRYS